MIKTKGNISPKAKGLQLELEQLKKAALTLRAINHKVRQQILNLIFLNKEITVSEIYYQLKLEQSLTSSHLALLRKAGIVNTRREGQSIYYSINHGRIAEIEKGSRFINGYN
jgi:ArsR family transcriptional regulator, virulence genes transcriptional regulator